MEAELIIKKLENTLSKEEEAVFNQWYEASRENRDYFEEQKKRYALQGKFLQTHSIDEDTARKRLMRRINADLRIKRKRSYRVYAIAASVALLVSLGVYFYDYFIPGDMPETAIEMGSSKAVLTLEDGTEVSLKEGEAYTSDHVSSDGESVVYATEKKEEIQATYNTLTVPRGGEFLLQLADGTKVWLNSDTKIKYPNAFTDGQPRIVELLYGEAFFEVSPAAMHGGSAFKVTTRNQEIEVLGTQFNVSAYREDQAVTSTLVEGKVAVSNGSARKELKPGEQAVVTEDSPEITINQVKVHPYTAWKDGFFSFRSKPLKEVMLALSRWYDIEVEFENKAVQDARFSGRLNRKQHIEDILSMVADNIDYEIKGKRVIIK